MRQSSLLKSSLLKRFSLKFSVLFCFAAAIFLCFGVCFPRALWAMQSEGGSSMGVPDSASADGQNSRVPAIYPVDVNAVVLSAMGVAADKAEDVVRYVGQNIGEYIREKEKEKQQVMLVETFYTVLEKNLRPYALTEKEEIRLARQVEAIYIEDGRDGTPELDTVAFHDMPGMIRKLYADMLLAETMNGEVMTYDLKGRPKTRWQLRDGKAQGVVVTFYPNGETQFIDHYESGLKTRRKKYDQDGRLEFEQVYDYSLKQEQSVRVEADTPAGTLSNSPL